MNSTVQLHLTRYCQDSVPQLGMLGADEDEEMLSETVRMLLRITQEKVSEGKGQDALAAVLHAIRLTRGKRSSKLSRSYEFNCASFCVA